MKQRIPFILVGLLLLAATFFTGCGQDHHRVSTTKSPLSILAEGNKRFYTEHPRHPHDDMSTVRELAGRQHPSAVVICCSDSRVSPELVFDQGLGDLFVIRTAGNVIGGIETGSIEYAIEHLDIKLVVIMGHRGCGAIQAYLDESDPPGHIKDIVDSIANEAEVKDLQVHHSRNADMYVTANVIHGVRQLTTQSDIIRERIGKSQLRVAGAVYNINDGKVAFIQ